MTEQLSMFEPTGMQVLELYRKHQRDCDASMALAETLSVRGWHAVAGTVLAAAERSHRLASEMLMLAEFEALAGLSS